MGPAWSGCGAGEEWRDAGSERRVVSGPPSHAALQQSHWHGGRLPEAAKLSAAAGERLPSPWV